MARRFFRDRGLTLIELLVTIAIVGTLIAVVGPSFKRLIDVQRVKGINNQLITDIQYARAEAAARSLPVIVKFGGNSAMTCYIIFVGNANRCDCTRVPGQACGRGAPPGPITGPLPGTTEIRTVQVPKSTDIQIQVQLSNLQTFTMIKFDPYTGRLQQPDQDFAQPPPAEFAVTVDHSVVGGFLDVVSIAGRPQVCTPGGAMSGYTTCP